MFLAKPLNKSVNSWKSPKPKIQNIPIPPNPLNDQKYSSKFTWDKKTEALKKSKRTADIYAKKVKELVLNNTREKYQLFKTLNKKNDKLNKNFKRMFHTYFPNKEDDLTFVNAPTF